MNRRDFIKNSLAAGAGMAVLAACGKGEKSKRAANAKVVTRQIGPFTLPLLSMGCMRLPTTGGAVDMPHFERMADYAITRGVNYFDTAYMYHGGQSESATGNVLANYKRESFMLATKCPLYALTSRADVRRIFEEQLKKCRVDYFDFYLAHNISTRSEDNYYNFKVYEELAQLKKEGKIKHLGFSYHGEPGLLAQVAQEHPWEFCQIQFNYLDWYSRDAKANYEILQAAKIPIISMAPLRGGALTTMTGSAKAVIDKEAPADSQASFGLRWVAGKENILTVLSGMSSLDQLKENVQTFSDYRPFTDGENQLAGKIANILQRRGEINCTACNYCYECPRGIAIPAIFLLYNEYRADGDAKAFLTKYSALKEREKADKCIHCRLCNANCPQLLEIPDLLDNVAAVVARLQKEVL